MITIRDWIPTIPEEEKHIAYVGENQTVIRQFFLTGAGWETYQDWSFHLDMAFDLSSVTNREQRKIEKTQVNNMENVIETQVKTTGTTTKESYMVEDVDVDCSSPTDIAALDKVVQEDGILLTWEVLRQHTQLPGKLTATIRALGVAGKVKKSDLMVFEVEPAVVAEPAAELTQSEFEAMEERIGLKAGEAAASAHYASLQAESALSSLSKIRDIHEESVDKMEDLLVQTRTGIQRVFDYHPSTNLLNLETVTYGKGMNKNGVMGTVQGYDLSLTDYIAVKEGDVISYQRTNAITGKREYWGYYMVCLYDELFFHDNAEDCAWFHEKGMALLAEETVQALCELLAIAYVAPPSTEPAPVPRPAGPKAGDVVKLNKGKLYLSSVGSAAVARTGTFYLYDGKNVHGRYRVTNKKSKVEKKPIATNVSGWVVL